MKITIHLVREDGPLSLPENLQDDLAVIFLRVVRLAGIAVDEIGFSVVDRAPIPDASATEAAVSAS